MAISFLFLEHFCLDFIMFEHWIELLIIRISFGNVLIFFLSYYSIRLWMDRNNDDYNVIHSVDKGRKRMGKKKIMSRRNKIDLRIACVAHILCTNVQRSDMMSEMPFILIYYFSISRCYDVAFLFGTKSITPHQDENVY